MTRNRHNCGERGNSILEFALVATVLVPTMLAVVGLGMSLGNAVKTSQIVRDSAHMFARGVDFGTNANKDIIVRLAASFGMTRTGGNGTVILSKIITPRQEDCDAANLTNDCANKDIPVFIHRMAIGNTGLRSSSFGSPTGGLVSADGNISVNDYLREPSARANGFATVLTNAGLTQGRGEMAYVVEGFFAAPSLRFLGTTANGMYCRYIF